MGKYMRKTGRVAAMEGVRTRAKTLALQKLQPPPPPPPPPPAESSYLQLRNRRLEKVLSKDCCQKNPNPSSRILNPSSRTTVSAGSVSISCLKDEKWVIFKEDETEEHDDLGMEASFGDNNLDFDSGQRSTRESTPCSVTRELDAAGTPGSTTRQTGSAATSRRIRNAIQRNIPTMHEIEEFFACAEQHQRRFFIEKYNFDVVNDLPLHGRFEWVTVHQ